MFYSFKNSRISYSSAGTGNPIILLHGFLESSTIWKDTAEELSSRRQVICIDLLGHGDSDCLEESHTMEVMAEVVHSVMKQLNIKKADFLGHSMGGYVALAFTENYPEMVNKLILLNSTPSADSEERRQNRKRSIALVEKNKRAFVSMAISNLLTSLNNQNFKEEIQVMKKRALQFPTEGITKALAGMKNRKDRTKVLREFKGEKVILAGQQDPILNYNDIIKTAEECNCSFYSLPDGHLSYLENKEIFFRTMYFIE